MANTPTRYNLGVRGSWFQFERMIADLRYPFNSVHYDEHGIWLHLTKKDMDFGAEELGKILKAGATVWGAYVGWVGGAVGGGAAGSVVPGAGTAAGATGGGAGGAIGGATLGSVIGELLNKLSGVILDIIEVMTANNDGSIDIHMSPSILSFGARGPGVALNAVDPNYALPGVWPFVRVILHKLNGAPGQHRMKAMRLASKDQGEAKIESLQIKVVQPSELPLVQLDAESDQFDDEKISREVSPIDAQAPFAIETVFIVSSGKSAHIVPECPALRNSANEIEEHQIPGTRDLDDIQERFGLPICGTCLRMLQVQSDMYCAESALQRLEIRNDGVLLITKGGFFTSEKSIFAKRSDLVKVERAGIWPYLLLGPRLLIHYFRATEHPSGNEIKNGVIRFPFKEVSERDDAYEVAARLVE
jgi:hypothetical protein